jgi:hypothetical protein
MIRPGTPVPIIGPGTTKLPFRIAEVTLREPPLLLLRRKLPLPPVGEKLPLKTRSFPDRERNGKTEGTSGKG